MAEPPNPSLKIALFGRGDAPQAGRHLDQFYASQSEPTIFTQMRLTRFELESSTS